MSFSITSDGDWKKTEKWLRDLNRGKLYSSLQSYGDRGVAALRSATPVDRGLTANSWTYDVKISRDSAEITWSNTNVNSGANIAILLQYGHGTGTGGFVSGRDYINPAIQPIFDQIEKDVWKKVTNG
jgi:hypothetical protein